VDEGKAEAAIGAGDEDDGVLDVHDAVPFDE
jgi:hypothetical protein